MEPDIGLHDAFERDDRRNGHPFTFRYGLEDLEATQLTPAQRYAGAGEAPFYLQDWFGVDVLLCWLVAPVAIGYYRFQKADL